MEDAEFAMHSQTWVKEWVNTEKGPIEEWEKGENLPPSATLRICATFGYLQKQLLTKSLAVRFIGALHLK